MKAIIKFIAILNTFVFSSTYVVIGDYKELNPKNCGISQFISANGQIDSSCFKWHNKWHKNTDLELKSAKFKFHVNDPWTVFIKTRPFSLQSGSEWVEETNCSGTLIANQWVLTAARCVHSQDDIQIFLSDGTNNLVNSKSWSVNWRNVYVRQKYDIHPWYDLALIKVEGMNMSYNISSTGHNNICLPEKWSGVAPDPSVAEYAMTSKWGSFNRSVGFLRLKYWRIPDLELFKYSTGVDLTVPISRSDCPDLKDCVGDPGSAIWQYYMGRAVIGAVLVKTIPERYAVHSAIGVRVDTEMDWISNTTKLN